MKFIKTVSVFVALFAIATAFGGWEWRFDERNQNLILKSAEAEIEGKLVFHSGEKSWKIASSRDGVNDRLALVDPDGEVQGYVRLVESAERIEILFYHRTAQAFEGRAHFVGNLKFHADSFPCRSLPFENERILNLQHGNPFSLLNDSAFSPANDALVRINAPSARVVSAKYGEFSLSLSGNIEDASKAVFTIEHIKDYYKNRWVPYYKPLDRARVPVTPSGWMSWNTYFDKATAADNLKEARIGAKYLKPFGCEIWSIESWQGNSDKLPVSKFYNMDLEVNEAQFPDGMQKLADDIRALGFKPGLWVAPFGTGNEEFYKKHKDWFLHDSEGAPIRSWNGVYTLDPTVPEARAHLKNIFHKASRNWGYEFFKIDGMSGRRSSYCAHLYERPEVRARFADPACPNPMELCISAFREGIGEDRIFLACQGHATGPEAAYADAARTGADIVHPNKPVMWNNVLLQARCTLNQIFTHNISMIADPDTVLVRDLTLEEARTSATIVALTGQLTFFGDKLEGLPPERMKILQQTLPPQFVRPMNLYPYFRMHEVWNLALGWGEFSRNVVAFFNWGDEDKIISADAKELGVTDDSSFCAYEFWEGKVLGEIKSRFAIKVPAHGVRLVSLRRTSDFPQWIGSDRHIAQTGFELKKSAWDNSQNIWRGSLELVGEFPLTAAFYIPEGYKLKGILSMNACSEIVEYSDHVLRVKFTGDTDKTSVSDVEIEFLKTD